MSLAADIVTAARGSVARIGGAARRDPRDRFGRAEEEKIERENSPRFAFPRRRRRARARDLRLARASNDASAFS
jgi:hypothetical protein